MPTFVLSLDYTDQGIRGIKDALKRRQVSKELAKKLGVEGEADLSYFRGTRSAPHC